MTDQPAAFKASFHSLRSVVGRGQIQLIFEIPTEALSLVGGSLVADSWYGIARLQEQPMKQEAKPKNREAQKAAMYAGNPQFWTFLWENHTISTDDVPDPSEEAAQFIRDYCGVESRASLTSDNKAWNALQGEFEAWKRDLI